MLVRVFKLLRTVSPLLFLSVCACSRPLEGQAFVVTGGAGNYKLGLVPIFVLNKGDYNKVRSRYSELATKIKTAKQEAPNEAHEKAASLNSVYEAESSKADALVASYKEAEQALVAFTGASNLDAVTFDDDPEIKAREVVQRYIKDLQPVAGFTPSQAPATAGGVPHKLYASLKPYLPAATSERDPDVIAANLLRIAKNYYVQLKTLKSDYDNKYEACSKNQDTVRETLRKYNEAVDLISYAEQNLDLNEKDKHGLLAEALLVATPATKTDGDGNFKLDNVGGAKYLIALSERKVGSGIEQYAWIIPLSESDSFSGKGNLILSNDNMSSPDVLLN